MTKKKKAIIIIAVCLAIVLSFIGGQTFSKYATAVKGEGIAEVATWHFLVNGQSEQIQNISLMSTATSATVANNKIAPGTSGSFNIIIDGTGSEVGIDYKIKISDESIKPTNLKFIYNGIEYNSITELEDILSGKFDANDLDKSRIITIDWKWDYQTGTNEEEIRENDNLDTMDAKNISNYTFNITISGTQVEPQV